MWIPSKFNVLYLLVALMCIEQSASSWQLGDSSHDLCKDKDHDDFELQLQAAMLFRKGLILIDHQWNVYQVPHSSMNNSYSQLLIDIVSQPIEQYWPAFAKLDNWTRVKPKVTTIYHVDVKTPFLYMIVQGEEKGLCYNLDREDFSCGSPIYSEAQEERRITNNGPIRFTIRNEDSSNVSLFISNMTWSAEGYLGWTKDHIIGLMYYTWNRTTPDLKNITVINKKHDPSKVISPDFTFSHLDWHLPPGFLYKGNFHFLDRKDVYTFRISPLVLRDYTQFRVAIRASNPLKVTSVKAYFQCVHLNLSGATFPPEPYSLNPGTASNGIAYWIWIVLVVVLLLIVAIIALLVWYFALDPKSAQSKSKKAKTSTQTLSKHGHGSTTSTVKQSTAVKDKKK